LHGIGNLLDKVKENNLEKQYIFKANIFEQKESI